MPDVYHCAACGAMSTRRSDYTILKDIVVCHQCNAAYSNEDEVVTEWVDEAVEDAKTSKLEFDIRS